MKKAIKNFPGAVIIVTHSEGFIEEIANRLVIFDRGKADIFEGGYKDFIRRIGWGSEEAESKKETNKQGNKESSKEVKSAKKLSKKELRQLKAQKAKELAPLKKIENEIMRLEKEVEKDNAELIKRTVHGYGEKEAELSTKIANNKKRIEGLFLELEAKNEELKLT